MKNKTKEPEKPTKIIVPYGSRRKMSKIFKCSEGTISDALSGHYDSELTKKIRHVALTQFEGVEMAPIKKKK